MARCCQIVLSEMNLGLYNGEFVAEVSESVVLPTIAFEFGRGVPVIKVGDGMAESVKCWGRPKEEALEPTREWLGDIRG
jgi:hypothetical protein